MDRPAKLLFSRSSNITVSSNTPARARRILKVPGGIFLEPLDDKNTAQLLQQMRRQTEIRPEQEESSTGFFKV